MSSKNHTIVLPTDERLRERLRKKLIEYNARISEPGSPWEFQHPELAHKLYHDLRDACYKAHVLEMVLASAEPVDTRSLSLEMAEKYGDAFDLKQFSNACGVIAFYCGNNAKKAIGGTGLPES